MIPLVSYESEAYENTLFLCAVSAFHPWLLWGLLADFI